MGNFNELLGKTITEIQGLEKGSDEIVFKTKEGIEYLMYHSQDCCEHVSVEDIHGDKVDVVASPVIHAEVVTNSDKNPEGFDTEYQDSFTWTYYYLSTEKGSITIRWYGESNGYYSEEVDFHEKGKNSWD